MRERRGGEGGSLALPCLASLVCSTAGCLSDKDLEIRLWTDVKARLGLQPGKSPEPVLLGTDKNSVQISLLTGGAWSKSIQLDNLGIKGAVSLVQEVLPEGTPSASMDQVPAPPSHTPLGLPCKNLVSVSSFPRNPDNPHRGTQARPSDEFSAEVVIVPVRVSPQRRKIQLKQG